MPKYKEEKLVELYPLKQYSDCRQKEQLDITFLLWHMWVCGIIYNHMLQITSMSTIGSLSSGGKVRQSATRLLVRGVCVPDNAAGSKPDSAKLEWTDTMLRIHNISLSESDLHFVPLKNQCNQHQQVLLGLRWLEQVNNRGREVWG